MGTSQTIILWGRDDGLGSGIQRLLPDNDHRKLIWIEETSNSEDLIQAVKKEAPNVVIIYAGDQFNDDQLSAQLIHLLPNIKILVLSLENNVINVYDRHQINFDSFIDLLATIEE